MVSPFPHVPAKKARGKRRGGGVQLWIRRCLRPDSCPFAPAPVRRPGGNRAGLGRQAVVNALPPPLPQTAVLIFLVSQKRVTIPDAGGGEIRLKTQGLQATLLAGLMNHPVQHFPRTAASAKTEGVMAGVSGVAHLKVFVGVPPPWRKRGHVAWVTTPTGWSTLLTRPGRFSMVRTCSRPASRHDSPEWAAAHVSVSSARVSVVGIQPRVDSGVPKGAREKGESA
jgi:hypothetical protein